MMMQLLFFSLFQSGFIYADMAQKLKVQNLFVKSICDYEAGYLLWVQSQVRFVNDIRKVDESGIGNYFVKTCSHTSCSETNLNLSRKFAFFMFRLNVVPVFMSQHENFNEVVNGDCQEEEQ